MQYARRGDGIRNKYLSTLLWSPESSSTMIGLDFVTLNQKGIQNQYVQACVRLSVGEMCNPAALKSISRCLWTK